MFTDFCFPLNSSCKTVYVRKLQNVYIYCLVYVHKCDNKSPNIIKTESPKKKGKAIPDWVQAFSNENSGLNQVLWRQ